MTSMSLEKRVGFSWLPAEVAQDQAFNEKYVIERQLGVGGSGVVVCARHRALDERVAIKFLLPGPLTQEALTRFRQEAKAAHRVRNEHVVRIIDVSTTQNDIPYIVMEYLEGVDLEQMLRETPGGQLPVADAVEFVLQAGEAVAESHGLDIVHRDLKPSNLFRLRGADGLPLIKVLDFGISKLGSATIDTDITGGGTRVLGSPRYMSPEQFESSTDVDRRTDVWSLGVVLYELIAGRPPFDDSDLFRLRRAIRNDPPQRITKFRADVPAGLESAVLRCLEKDREKRFSDLAELAKALQAFAPARARSSIARIVRIVRAPGGTTGSLGLLGPRESTSNPPMIQSVPMPGPRAVRRARRLVRIAAIGLVLVVIGWRFWRHPVVDQNIPSSKGSTSAAMEARTTPATTEAVAAALPSPRPESLSAPSTSAVPQVAAPAASSNHALAAPPKRSAPAPTASTLAPPAASTDKGEMQAAEPAASAPSPAPVTSAAAPRFIINPVEKRKPSSARTTP